MKKSLLLVIILCCSSSYAQEENDTWLTVAKKNWEDATENPWVDVYYSDDAIVEIVDDGLAVNNPHLQDESWFLQVPVLTQFSLEEGHNYIVRLTIKVPSNGIYHVGMGSWDGRGIWTSCLVPVEFRHDFQIIDVEYPEYIGNIYGDGIVMIGFGWVAGTTIIKEVEILEKASTAGIQGVKAVKGTDDAIYNLAGQRVDAAYKGIVIRNGRKEVK